MIKWVVGGAITAVIGGTAFTISQSNVVNNFSKNTGLSQEQAQQYVNNIKPSDLASFSEVGKTFVSDGNSILTTQSSIDCENYTYPWETSSLSCPEGKQELQSIGNAEIALGNCYQALDTDLGSSATSKINECLGDIDTVNSEDALPIATSLLDSNTLTNAKNNNAYNKSVLEAALQSRH